MRLEKIECEREIHGSGAQRGVIWMRPMPECAQALLRDYAGQVQCIYIDPPFNTGKRFEMHMRVGERGYLTGKPSIRLEAYDDRYSDEAYLSLMRATLETAHALLRADGTIFVHIDSRMYAYVRLLLDEIFGREHFLNEIIWAYQTGGRALEHFSRKHDIILFYRKSRNSFFDIRRVPVPRAENRQNHMKRCVDADGRTYRTIRSSGKEYRYYDDEPAYPGDVWDDVSHLQQKDPQRTGYDTQKPLKLLERIVRCASREGDLVGDLFFGSGTTLACCAREGRRFIGVDASKSALAVARKRLLGFDMEIDAPASPDDAALEAQVYPALGFSTVALREFAPQRQAKGVTLGPMDAVDQWSVGFVREGTFHVAASEARSKAAPALTGELELPMVEGRASVEIIDIWGERHFYRLP